jgi:quercetin 2,3-dioxygenase
MTGKIRKAQLLIEPQTLLEGAGVKIKRSIATRQLDYLDPFLLFDHFGSDDPRDYIKGFPMHPHRGIETVTYVLAGEVDHQDSIGNAGTIGAGDIQWMTAGRGIMHEEMPRPRDGKMGGFQLWVNLPSRLKMTAPHYQEVASDNIPEIIRQNGTKIRIIAGRVGDRAGAITDIAADPTYLDVTLPPQTVFDHPVQAGHTVFAYLFEGEASFGDGDPVDALRLISFQDGESFVARTIDRAARFLLVSGKPLHEPVARYGPFVMNTQKEIEQAIQDIQNGTFVS